MLKSLLQKNTHLQKEWNKRIFKKKNSKTISPLHANKNCDAFEYVFFKMLDAQETTHTVLQVNALYFLFLGWVGEMIKNI